ncbi:MAG TPA: hypothetical protein VMJ30_05295, partial [Gemmatimonadales bacterium]|nr:hypothetical protein [Gemmatimonadales bacterium]
ALEGVIMRCLAKRPADRWQSAGELAAALEPLATPSGGMTPTHTQPVTATGTGVRKLLPGASGLAIGVALVCAVLFFWRPWAGRGGRELDPNLVAVLPFRVAGADPSVQYLRQGMVDLLQTKLTGEAGPRAADARSVLAAVRDAGGSDTQDLPETALPGVARKLGAGQVLQGSIVGPADHLVISASLVAMPGGKSLAEASVTGPKDSLFTLIDRLTGQLLALGAGTSASRLSSLTTTNLDALRAYLDGMSAFRRGSFIKATPLFDRAVELDSTFALALSAAVEAYGWNPGTGDLNRIRRLAWQYRNRLNPRDQAFLALRLGSLYPAVESWDRKIANDEKAVQQYPESADAWYYLGDDLFHEGMLSDVPEPLLRARQALEKAFERDSLAGGPIQHLARLTYLLGDTAAQRLWTRRMMALDSASDDIAVAKWDMLRAAKDSAGIARYLASLDPAPVEVPQALLFFGTTDSISVANQMALLDLMHRKAVTTAERREAVVDRIWTLWNRGRPSEAARWVDTLRTISPSQASLFMLLGRWMGGEIPATSQLLPDQAMVNRVMEGDLGQSQQWLDTTRARARRDTLLGINSRLAPIFRARVAVMRKEPGAEHLVDVADSAWVGRDGGGSWAGLELAQLYMAQGRMDRALKAIRRRWLPLGDPVLTGLAESYRLEGKLTALTGDKVGAIRAYRTYLRMRLDPEPSKIPQRDSVRAELAALGDLEGKQ